MIFLDMLNVIIGEMIGVKKGIGSLLKNVFD